MYFTNWNKRCLLWCCALRAASLSEWFINERTINTLWRWRWTLVFLCSHSHSRQNMIRYRDDPAAFSGPRSAPRLRLTADSSLTSDWLSLTHIPRMPQIRTRTQRWQLMVWFTHRAAEYEYFVCTAVKVLRVHSRNTASQMLNHHNHSDFMNI